MDSKNYIAASMIAVHGRSKHKGFFSEDSEGHSVTQSKEMREMGGTSSQFFKCWERTRNII